MGRTVLRCALALVWLGCAGPPRLEVEAGPGPVPWTGGEAGAGPGAFKFVVVADRTGEHREGGFEQAMEKINHLQPAFVVSVGDLIEGYTEDRDEIATQWQEFDSFVARLEMPFFYAPGNHDMSNAVMAEAWRERFGPSYYHFLYEDVLFVVLNSELFSSVTDPGHPVPGPDTQAEQMAWLERALEQHEGVRWTLVFLHQPLWDGRRVPEDWTQVEDWLGDRPYTVFAGHTHRYTKHVRHDRRFLTLATTGGGSGLRGIDRGEFDHVALVSVGEGEPVVANLMLDGIHGDDVRTEATRSLMRRLDRALRIEPTEHEGRSFSAGEVRFTVQNEGQATIDVEGRFYADGDLTPSPATLRERVAPGESATLPVQLTATRPVPYEMLAPASATWTLRSTRSDGEPVSVEQHSWLLPERRFACLRAMEPIRVDGDLSDWGALRFVVDDRPDRPEAPPAARFRFGVRHDDDFVYVGVEVHDETPRSSGEWVARHQDGISILLDARPDPERSLNESVREALASGALDRMLVASLTPVEPKADAVLGSFLPPLPEGTLRAARPSASGYTGEIAIPRAFLDERQGGPWRSFRLNVTVEDWSADGREHTTRAWRPSRFGRGATPIPGSGTFDRAD